MFRLDFDSIKETLSNKWNLLIFIVAIKGIFLLTFFLINYQYFLSISSSFADHLYYTEFGTAISNGFFPSNQKSLGMPLLMAPFFALFKPDWAGPLFEPMKFVIYLTVLNATQNYAIAYMAFLMPLIPVSQSIILPWGFFNSLILGSLAPLALYKITNNILKNEKIAIISAIIFCLYPFIFISTFPKFIHMTGFLQLSDLTGLTFILFSVYFFTKIEKDEENDVASPLYNYFLLSIVAGFAVLIRVSNVLILVCFLIFLLFKKPFTSHFEEFRQETNVIFALFKSFWDLMKSKKKYFISIIIFGIIFSFQLIYNKIHFGGFLTFGYNWYYDNFYRFQWLLPDFQELGFVGIDYAILTPNGYISTTYMLNSILAIISGYLIEIIVGVIGIIFLIYRREKALSFLLSWLLSFILFYSLQGFTQLEIVAIRFLMPIIPVFCILIGVVIFVLTSKNFDWIKEKS
ncbi:MAG: hypothetical protein ACTSRG_04875 [Candidatus Helarchaeota archaeon]